MLSAIGLGASLLLLIVLTLRGTHLLVAAPVAALLAALCSGLPIITAPADSGLVTHYMSGFTGFIASWFFMFLLGAIFGQVMADGGGASSVAAWISRKLGPAHAATAVVLACAILTYGGVSLFVVAFAVYPLAVGLFRNANLPRRFIPGVMAFGSVTFTMTSAGSPEIQNWIPIQFLGTTPYAAWQVSLVAALFMFGIGMLWLRWMMRRALTNGETFETRPGDPEQNNRSLPHPISGLIPLALVLGVTWWLHEDYQQNALIAALGAGIIGAAITQWRHFQHWERTLALGAAGALVAIGNTAAVVGFGAVAKATPAFQEAVTIMTHLPGPPLIGAALAVSVIAGLTGSASGGQAIALPLIAPHYIEQGVDPASLHRVVAISSGALDSLPHNGYVVTTIRAICNETHRAAYGAMGALTVIVPLLGLLLALVLLSF